MWRAWVQAFQRLVHVLQFHLELVVLLVRVPCVIAIALQPLDFGVQLAFVLLGVADIFDS